MLTGTHVKSFIDTVSVDSFNIQEHQYSIVSYIYDCIQYKETVIPYTVSHNMTDYVKKGNLQHS